MKSCQRRQSCTEIQCPMVAVAFTLVWDVVCAVVLLLLKLYVMMYCILRYLQFKIPTSIRSTNFIVYCFDTLIGFFNPNNFKISRFLHVTYFMINDLCLMCCFKFDFFVILAIVLHIVFYVSSCCSHSLIQVCFKGVLNKCKFITDIVIKVVVLTNRRLTNMTNFSITSIYSKDVLVISIQVFTSDRNMILFLFESVSVCG